jgi:hypothetical protein
MLADRADTGKGKAGTLSKIHISSATNTGLAHFNSGLNF